MHKAHLDFRGFTAKDKAVRLKSSKTTDLSLQSQNILSLRKILKSIININISIAYLSNTPSVLLLFFRLRWKGQQQRSHTFLAPSSRQQVTRDDDKHPFQVKLTMTLHYIVYSDILHQCYSETVIQLPFLKNKTYLSTYLFKSVRF